jgi:hypothetical protein
MVDIPCGLTDDQLVVEVKRLARCEREMTAALVAHLAELDARRLYLDAGYSSLFTYCTDVLRLSEHEAYNRIEAARLARRFPTVLGMLADGALNLTSARLLAPHLTAENHEGLLAEAAGRSKREVEHLIAERFPLPDVPTSVRKLPSPRQVSAGSELLDAAPTGLAATPIGAPEVAGSLAPAGVAEPAAAQPGSSVLSAAASPSPARRRELVRPLAADRYEIRFTASAATREKLRLATDLLRHAVPTGDTNEIIDRALTALLENLAKKKLAAAARPRASHGVSNGTRHVPAHVKRTVWLREGGRCAFVGKGSQRCGERGFLEFHHVRPYGVGGAATIDNIELRCRAHNAHEADRFYGRRCAPPTKRAAAAELVPERVDSRRHDPSAMPRGEARRPLR